MEKDIIVKIPKYKKIWYSITKFEKYPEMATEGVGRAFSYLAWLIFMFSIILAIGILFKFNLFVNENLDYLNKNFNEISYKNGELSIKTTDNESKISIGNILINTQELTENELKEYENKTTLAKTELIMLKDRLYFKFGEQSTSVIYKDIFDKLEIKEFDKATLINTLTKEINSPRTYIIYGLALILYLFISYFISSLLDIVVLSVFGLITTAIAKIQMRYRAIFNMSVYAITLSTILQLIYIFVNLFTDFNIKYFDFMYSAISFVCLAAAIFMIKSDIIKQQMELMKVIEIKKQEQQKEEQEENKEEKEKEKNEEEHEEKKEEDKKDNKKEENEKESPDIEGQGSNA